MQIFSIFSHRKKAKHANSKVRLLPGNRNKGNPDILIAGYEELALSPSDKASRASLMRTYEKMLLDDKVSQVMEIVNSAVRSMPWSVVSDNPEVAEFITGNLNTLNLKQFVGNLLSARAFGFAVFEEIWEKDLSNPENPRYRIKEEKLLPYHRIEFVTDKYAVLRAIEFDGEEKPLEWFHIFTYPQIKPDSYHYGVSDLCKIYREWFTKDILKKYRNLGLENFAFPIVVAIYDENRYREGTREWEELLAMLDGLKDDSRVALPSGINPSSGELMPGVRLEFLEPKFGGGGFNAFERAIENENRAIARNLGLPDDLGFSDTRTGSYAKSRTEMQLYLQVVNDIAGIVEKNIQKIIDRLVFYNFQEASAKFKFDLKDETQP
jgi:hypothetical protein